MSSAQRVAAAVVGDEAMLALLRSDPSSLASALQLTRPQLQALRSADRFFASEKPILDAPGSPFPPRPSPGLRATAFQPARPPSTVVASGDTGTLLVGPTSGTVTMTGTATPPPPPAPGVPGVPQAPSAPHVPGIPQVPSAPHMPGIPQVPGAPHVPGIPQVPAGPGTPAPPPAVAPTPPVCAGCGCDAAIVAMVANVSVTAITAITAISATAASARSRAC